MYKNKLIAHVLLKTEEGYLVIKRTNIKRGQANVFPGYWDIPGGTVEEREFPQQAAIREAFEETGQKIEILGIVHEDSNFDEDKKTVFTRLVYFGKIVDQKNIILDHEEHTDFKFISEINNQDSIVDYLRDIFENFL